MTLGVRILVGGCRCATSWCDLNLVFDCSDLDLYNRALGYISEAIRCRKLILCREMGGGL